MSTHTPGPWYAANMGHDHQGLIIDEQTGANIAVSYDTAHAPFIAAAPDLLAALKRTQEVWSEWEPYAPWIGDAIRKAEGRKP